MSSLTTLKRGKKTQLSYAKQYHSRSNGTFSGCCCYVVWKDLSTYLSTYHFPACISQGSERPTRAVCLEAPKQTLPKTSPWQMERSEKSGNHYFTAFLCKEYCTIRHDDFFISLWRKKMQLINQPTNQPTNPPTDQPTDRPTNQPTNQSTNNTKLQSTNANALSRFSAHLHCFAPPTQRWSQHPRALHQRGFFHWNLAFSFGFTSPPRMRSGKWRFWLGFPTKRWSINLTCIPCYVFWLTPNSMAQVFIDEKFQWSE